MLAPLAVVGTNSSGALRAVVTYLLIYAAMNLGAFAVVLAVARKTRSAEISSWGGLFEYAPGLTVFMTVFLFSLAGIPPLGGWLAKFVVFRALVEPDITFGGVSLAVIVGVNSVIALYYYANIAKTMWMKPRARRRSHADPGAVLAQCRADPVGRRHRRLRCEQPRHPLRRPGQLPPGVGRPPRRPCEPGCERRQEQQPSHPGSRRDHCGVAFAVVASVLLIETTRPWSCDLPRGEDLG